MGGLGARDLSMDGTNLAYRLCGKLNGECHVIPAPLVVRSKGVRDSLLERAGHPAHPPAGRRTLDIAFVGIGSSYPEASALVRSGYLSKEESEALLRRGAVGNVLGRQIDVRGNLCPVALNDRIVGLDPAELKKIPVVVGVAAGAPKAEAILGAVRGKYINAPGHGRGRRPGACCSAAGAVRDRSARREEPKRAAVSLSHGHRDRQREHRLRVLHRAHPRAGGDRVRAAPFSWPPAARVPTRPWPRPGWGPGPSC